MTQQDSAQGECEGHSRPPSPKMMMAGALLKLEVLDASSLEEVDVFSCLKQLLPALETTLSPAHWGGAPLEASVQLASSKAVQTLNASYRHKNKPTNVLSFPAEVSLVEARQLGLETIPLGDIAVAVGVLRTQAQERAIPLEHHVIHLLLHGILHLYGFDHAISAEAAVMEDLEIRILTRLGIADPYVN